MSERLDTCFNKCENNFASMFTQKLHCRDSCYKDQSLPRDEFSRSHLKNGGVFKDSKNILRAHSVIAQKLKITKPTAGGPTCNSRGCRIN